MTPAAVQALFTQSDGQYRFARWGRPVVPVVFGAEDATLAVIKGAIEAVIRAAYDPVLPAVAHDASHALRLVPRVGRMMGGR